MSVAGLDEQDILAAVCSEDDVAMHLGKVLPHTQRDASTCGPRVVNSPLIGGARCLQGGDTEGWSKQGVAHVFGED